MELAHILGSWELKRTRLHRHDARKNYNLCGGDLLEHGVNRRLDAVNESSIRFYHYDMYKRRQMKTQIWSSESTSIQIMDRSLTSSGQAEREASGLRAEPRKRSAKDDIRISEDNRSLRSMCWVFIESDDRERCGLKKHMMTRLENCVLRWFGHLKRDRRDAVDSSILVISYFNLMISPWNTKHCHDSSLVTKFAVDRLDGAGVLERSTITSPLPMRRNESEVERATEVKSTHF
ncbi:hypothetical protein EVAR_81977_1 [Eumeta japonica]|uniref:Uncharacterized protein n=1 Tax=Eumeta variegata TaxID=151549 RepID=A0A4C1VXG6_EUMVA|nr:hypothetical protein EVAR_81977_1 [Eumeta japonica]